MKYAALLVMLLALLACRPLRTVRYVPAPAPATYGDAPAERRSNFNTARTSGRCGNWDDYLPDPGHPEYLPLRLLRVNFHVVDSRDGRYNLRPDQARSYLGRLLELANASLDANERNWRSAEGTAVLPIRYRYLLAPQPGDDGYYFHYDDTLYAFVSSGRNQNNYDRTVIKKYGVGLDSIVNIFVMVHPDDSLDSPTYKAGIHGIALGTGLKMAGLSELGTPPEHAIGIMNHEIGHILGLSHAWTGDGCDDTPPHPNKCWAWTETGPCRDAASNNMMDYNAYQRALTPCQIGQVHANFASERHPARRCAEPTWCAPQPGADVVIRDSLAWHGARDLEGNLTVAAGGALYLSRCRVSLPEGARVTVEPGARLYLDGTRLHNACGKAWDGIFVQERGGQKGEVIELAPVTLENVAAGTR